MSQFDPRPGRPDPHPNWRATAFIALAGLLSLAIVAGVLVVAVAAIAAVSRL